MAKLLVKRPDGRFAYIPQESWVDAKARGYRLATNPEARAVEDRQKYDDSEGTAFAAGVGRGLTFGLSDVALTESGLVKPETLRGLEEYNPGSSIAGELGGIAGSLLMPGLGQLGAAGRVGQAGRIGLQGARAITAAPRAVARLGSFAERALARGLEPAATTAGKILQRAGVRATGGAVEGAVYGTGHFISRQALEDESSLTGESLLASVGLGMVLGGAAGGLLGAGEVAVPKALSSGLEASRAVVDRAKNSISPSLRNRAASMYSGLVEMRTGIPKSTVRELLNETSVAEPMLKKLLPNVPKKQLAHIQKNIAFLSQDAVDDLAVGFAGRVSKQTKLARELESELYIARKADMEMHLMDVPPEKALTSLQHLEQRIAQTIMLFERSPEQFSHAATKKRLMKFYDAFVRERSKLYSVPKDSKPVYVAEYAMIGNTPTKGTGVRTVDVFYFIEHHRKLLDDMSKYGFDVAKADLRSFRAVAELRNDFRSIMTSEPIFGGFAARLAGINSAVNTYKTALANLEKTFGNKVLSRTGRKQVVISPQKLNTFLKQTGTPAAEIKTAQLREFLEAVDGLAEQVTKVQSSSPVVVSGAKELFDALTAEQKAAIELIERFNLFKGVRTRAREGLGLFELGTGLGTYAGAGSIPGALVAGKIAQIGRDPAGDILLLTKLGMARKHVQDRVGRAVRKFLEVKVPVVKEIPAKQLSTVAALEGVRLLSPKRKGEEPYDRLRRDLLKLEPVGIENQLAESIGGLGRDLPNTHGALTQQAHQTISFLQERLPTNIPRKEAFGLPSERPNAQARRKYERYLLGALQPMTILKNLETGRISREEVEVLQVLYPSLYAELQKKVQELLSKGKGIGTYSQRAKAARLFGLPTPGLSTYQNLHRELAAEDQSAPTRGRPKKITAKQAREFEEAHLTQAERIEYDK